MRSKNLSEDSMSDSYVGLKELRWFQEKLRTRKPRVPDVWASNNAPLCVLVLIYVCIWVNFRFLRQLADDVFSLLLLITDIFICEIVQHAR